MKVKEAAKLAMAYVADLFGDEKIENLGLEEIEFDDGKDCWQVTIGFSRPWDYARNGIAARLVADAPRRSYKLVTLRNDTGEVLSVKNREVSPAS